MMADSVLLPQLVKPLRYEIYLAPDLEKTHTFTGTLTIEVEVTQATKSVSLHAHQLSISDVEFVGGDGKKVAAETIAFNLKSQTVTFGFGEDLPVTSGSANGRLSMSFRGTLNDELAGFYRSKYTVTRNNVTETRYMAVTQFEATDARRCFPCWDEPAAKASYKITVAAPSDRQVISNMHAERIATSPDGKTKTHHFAETPVMSTYLVAVCVGEWDTVSAISPNLKIPTTVYCPLGKGDQGMFGLKVAVDAIEYLQELFGVPYMGTKSDLLAIPDFAAGAMENMGCVTYREAAILIDEKESSLASRQRVAQVVAHELSHQWFGNWTTMHWWTHLWLNEGFAKHMEYVVTNKLFPQWDVWSSFTAMIQSNAFNLDSMASTHPVEVDVKHPDEINEIFDTISYQKGASIIRMLFNWIGPETAFKGLNSYLSAHKFKNAVTEELWDALSQVSGQPVAAVMRKWTGTSGYPYLHIQRNGSTGGVTLASKRFTFAWARNPTAWPTGSDFPSGASVKAAADAAQKYAPVDGKGADAINSNDDWCIPVSVVVGGSAAGGSDAKKLGVLLLDPAAADPSLSRDVKLQAMAKSISDAVAGASWFKMNAGHGNFVRTVYDASILANLQSAVSTPSDRSRAPSLSTTDRIGLIGDVAACVSVGFTPASDFLRFVKAFQYETDYSVWVSILDAVSDLRSSASGLAKADNGAAVGAIDAFTRTLLKDIVAYVGWEAKSGEHPNTALLRALVLRIAAVSNMESVVAEALSRFDAYAAGKGSIPADLKQLVYNTASSHGGQARWDALFKLFKSATMSEEQRRLMTALGRASDAALLSNTLRLILSDDVRSQDSAFVMMAVASNPGDAGRTLAWDFVKTNWDAIHKRVGGGNFIWASLMGAATHHFDSKDAADDIASWFGQPGHAAGSADRTIKQSLEAIRTRAWKVHLLSRDPAGFEKTAKELAA